MIPASRPSHRAIPLNIVGIFLLLMFLFGAALGAIASDRYFPSPQSTGSDSDGIDTSLLQTIYEQIDDHYAKTLPSETDLSYGAAKGLVDALGDPYSNFMDPSDAEEFNNSLSGTFQGIGAEIGVNDQGAMVIIAPLPGFPAEKAGLLAGDEIVAIDDVETNNLNVDEAVLLIRGEGGSTVTLTIHRTGEDSFRDFDITRETIKIESVNYEIQTHSEKTIGVLRITRFSDDTEQLVEDAVEEFLLRNVDGIVLDLRNNPGGYLNAAVNIGGYMVGKEVVVIERKSDNSEKKHVSPTEQSLKDIPLVVLVNGGSASASEILAGAIQDYDTGTILGEVTFGKGSVQEVIEFDDKSLLKLTTAQWLTPNGVSIEDSGITPDMVVPFTDDDAAADRDPQFDRAIQELVGS